MTNAIVMLIFAGWSYTAGPTWYFGPPTVWCAPTLSIPQPDCVTDAEMQRQSKRSAAAKLCATAAKRVSRVTPRTSALCVEAWVVQP